MIFKRVPYLKAMYLRSIIFILGSAFSTSANAQEKLANYSFGAPGTDKYEHFSFWADHGKHTRIEYRYGKNQTSMYLKFAGKTMINGRQAFKVLFPNKLVLTVIPSGKNLTVTGSNYRKIFVWEYEGPRNGVGTFCAPCTEDEHEAMNLLKAFYLQ